jgi:transposase, IS30 family
MAHLTLTQRYEIDCLLRQNFSQTQIAEAIGKHKSVICREIRRNADQRNKTYKADLAQKKAEQRQEEKPKKIYFTAPVKAFVEDWLRQDYSPEQIVGTAARKGVACVSVERIYQFIWQDKKAGGAWYKHLRGGGKKYRKRGQSKDKRGQIVGRVGIEERPLIVEEKMRLGDLEMDLVIGKEGALLTINDRASGMLKMAKIESKEAALVEAKACELLAEWKPFLQTITSDNGKEFALHQSLAQKLDIAYYFAHPYQSWERGANENLNGLIRQYFPKKSDFGELTEAEVKGVENILNQRPRKRFGYQSPNEVFSQALKNKGKVAFVT